MLKYRCLLPLVLALCSMSNARGADSFFDSNGVKIRYATAGAGEPVVLIHGWMGDSTMWGAKLSAPEGFQLIAFDCRGHGKSDKPHDPDKYGVEMSEDVVRLLDHLKIKKAHLIGYSMGAFIVGKVAATHSDRVLSVTYGGQAPIIAGPKSPGSNEVEVFAKAVDEGKGLGPYLMSVWPADRPKLTLDQANALCKLMYGEKDVKAYAVSGLSLPKLEVTAEDLRKCKAPTLFIYGGNESRYVKDRIAEARQVLPSSQVKVVEGSDHVSTPAKPEFGQTILAFLNSVRTK